MRLIGLLLYLTLSPPVHIIFVPKTTAHACTEGKQEGLHGPKCNASTKRNAGRQPLNQTARDANLHFAVILDQRCGMLMSLLGIYADLVPRQRITVQG